MLSSRQIGRRRDGRPVVVVLGMHRSGTSLLSNLLHYLGVDMADTTDHVSERNAGGFWERPALNVLQDEVLAAIGRPIASPEHCLPFPPAWWRRKEVQAIKPRLLAFVEDELARSTNLWGFKDPRTCRLLPLWWEIFRALDLEPVYVHAVRSPAESAISMSLKNPARAISPGQGELMWIAYNYDILRHVALERPTLTVIYDDWFADGAQVARRLADALGIGEGFADDDLRECVEAVVSPALRNHVAGSGGAVSRMPIADLLYAALVAEQRAGGAGARTLKNQMAFIGLLMKSTAPIVGELAAQRATPIDAAAEQRRRADALAEERREGADRLSVARSRGRRLAQALAARDERIADLETRLAAMQGSGAPGGGRLVLPGGGPAAASGEDYGFAGRIERVDRGGIAGWVRFTGRPDLIPIVELAIDGAFVLAQACIASGDRHVFAIDWRDVPTGHAGRPAVVRVAGIERTVDGPALIVPGGQRRLHQTPAYLAAELFGGTVAQAEAYHAWLAAHDEDAALDEARSWLAARDTASPLISVILFGDGAGGAIEATIDALKAQLYPDWEALCPGAPTALEALDPRVRAIPAGSVLRVAAAGELVSFVETGDLIARTALLHLAAAARNTPGFALIYSDEDRIDPLSGVRGAPCKKGGWSDDLARAQDHASRLALIRRDALPRDAVSLDRAAVRQIVTAAASAAPANVVHLPLVLYHRALANARAEDAER